MKDFSYRKDEATGDLVLQQPRRQRRIARQEGHFANLAATGQLSDETLNTLATTLLDLVEHDDRGRSEWKRINAEAYELLGIGGESDPDDEDGGEGDTSTHPLMLTALTRFQSKGLAALLPNGTSVCRAEPSIDISAIEDPDERERIQEDSAAACDRVRAFYSDYFLERLRGYEADTDTILHSMGMQGVGIRKVTVNRSKRRTPVRPERVNPEDLIISYDAKTFACGRITQRINMKAPELVRAIRGGDYAPTQGLTPDEIEIGPVERAQNEAMGLVRLTPESNDNHLIYEVHGDFVLREDRHADGFPRPYVISIHAASQRVLAIRRNWEEHDEDEERIEHFVAYSFFPGSDPTQPYGLGHLLSNITRALRSAQRSALDSAYLQNHPSGFKASTFSIRDEASKIRSGEFVDVDIPSGASIRDSLLIQPFEGPSPGLIEITRAMEANGKELGGLATIDFAELMKVGIAAGPALAAYEESSVFQNAVHRRLYQAHAKELTLVHERMKQVVGNQAMLYGAHDALRPGDLMKVKLLPAMKPGQASRQQEILEAQANFDFAMQHPDIADRRVAGEKFLRALNSSEVDDILLPAPEDEEPPPAADPVTEYGWALKGQPLRAAPHQSHQAHIDAHDAQLRGLQHSALPVEQGDAAAAALAAHIADHMAQQLLVEVAARIGLPIEQLAELPPEMEAQIAPQIAIAIREIEAARAAASQEDTSKIEELAAKVEGEMTRDALKHRHAKELEELKHRHKQEQQRADNEAHMEREMADNEAALDIASMRAGGRSNATAGARSAAGAGAGASAQGNAGSGGTS